MSRELIPPGADKAMRRAANLKLVADRQLVSGEQVEFGGAYGKQYINITDRRIVISSAGSFMGERAESIPLGVITGVATTMKGERITMMQLAVPGRTWGELILQGEDLGPVHAALIRCLPIQRSAA